MRTVSIGDATFAIAPETVRALVAAARSGTAPAMLLGCCKCQSVCVGGYSSAPVNAPCKCCILYVEMRKLKPSGRGRASASDIGQHVRAPLGSAMRTLTKTAA